MAWYRPKSRSFQAVRILSLPGEPLGPGNFSEFPEWLALALRSGAVRLVPGAAGGPRLAVADCFCGARVRQLEAGDWILDRGARGVQPVTAGVFRARFEEGA